MLNPETVKWLRRELQRAEKCVASARKGLQPLVAQLWLDLPAGQGPPACRAGPEGEREVVRGERLLPPDERKRPFPPDIRGWVMLLGRMAGWRPSKRRSLTGNEVLWRAYVQIQGIVLLWQNTRAL